MYPNVNIKPRQSYAAAKTAGVISEFIYMHNPSTMFLSGCAGNLLFGFMCPLPRAVEGVPPFMGGDQSCPSVG